MAAELKTKVVRGFAWNVAERIASAVFQAWVAVNVINRVLPEDTALIALLAAFVVVFNSFVDSGFSQALIRNKTASDIDYSSAFWFNIAVSSVIYILLVALSFPVATFFKMPELVKLAPVFFLVIPLGALGIIQQTVLTREFDFRRLSGITFSATIVSGIVEVGLAFAGFGIWAMVGQRLIQSAVRSLLLWIFGRWKPSARFSVEAIKKMFGYSSRLLATDLLNNLYISIPTYIIGHIDRGTLGLYDNARKVSDQPINSTRGAMQSVTFPALATVSDDDAKFAKGVGKVIGSMTFLMFPMMAGLIAVAGELFGVFLKTEWQASVPFFRILCLAGLVMPISIISSNILRTRSDGRAVIRTEVVKKVFATVIFAATIPFGVLPITWGVVGIAFTDAAVSFATARRYSSYGFGALARDVLPTLGLTIFMAAAVWGTGWLLGTFAPEVKLWIVLAAKIGIGIVIYLIGAALLRLDGFREFLSVVKKVIGK